MNQKTILKISLAISVIGIFFLLCLSSIPPPQAKISELNSSQLNSHVRISGKIISDKKINRNFYILEIQDSTGKIQVLLNKNFSSDKTLEITGRLAEYKDKLQIQAEKIMER